MYDSAKPVEMKGTVTKVEWTNPHARFYIDVRDDKGQVQNWNFELCEENNQDAAFIEGPAAPGLAPR
jgi:hypothetical protein